MAYTLDSAEATSTWVDEAGVTVQFAAQPDGALTIHDESGHLLYGWPAGTYSERDMVTQITKRRSVIGVRVTDFITDRRTGVVRRYTFLPSRTA